DCKSSSIYETGAVEGGHLIVSGLLVHAKYHYAQPAQPAQPGSGSASRHVCERDGKAEEFYADFSTTHDDPDTIPKSGDTVTILLLATFAPIPLSTHLPNLASGFAALILRHSTYTPGAFERLGFMSTHTQSLLSWFNGAEIEEAMLV